MRAYSLVQDYASFSFEVKNGTKNKPQYIAFGGKGEFQVWDDYYYTYSGSNCDIEGDSELVATQLGHKEYESLDTEIIHQAILNIGPVLLSNIAVSVISDKRRIAREKGKVINDFALLVIQVVLVVQCQGHFLQIKREMQWQLDEKPKINQCIISMLEEIAVQYRYAFDLPFISIDHEQEQDVLLPAGRGGIVVHEALGHLLEADHFFAPDNILAEKMDKRVCAQDICVYDTKDESIGFRYSDEGTKKKTTILVEKGYLVNILTDLTTAQIYSRLDSGNGRADRYDHIPLPRMGNTYMENGSCSPSEILASVNKGIYINDVGGGSVDYSTGVFTFSAGHGYLYENGVPVANITPFLFIGNTLDFLQRIEVVGNDLNFCVATCGKKGQFVRVCYGMPTIKVRGQKVGVQRKVFV